MAHLNGRSLQSWKKGEGLAAADLNSNFDILAERIETTMARVVMPEPAVVDLEMRHAAVAQRVQRLEELTNMHARQRNEREWAPLSHVGALVVLVNDANRRMEDACRRIEEMHAGLGVEHEDLDRRLQRLEQQPDAAAQEDFAVLSRDHDRLALKEHMLLAQVIALRHEVTLLREMAMGHARQRNEVEWTPLSTTAHLLERIMKLEQAR